MRQEQRPMHQTSLIVEIIITYFWCSRIAARGVAPSVDKLLLLPCYGACDLRGYAPPLPLPPLLLVLAPALRPDLYTDEVIKVVKV